MHLCLRSVLLLCNTLLHSSSTCCRLLMYRMNSLHCCVMTQVMLQSCGAPALLPFATLCKQHHEVTTTRQLYLAAAQASCSRWYNHAKGLFATGPAQGLPSSRHTSKYLLIPCPHALQPVTRCTFSPFAICFYNGKKSDEIECKCIQYVQVKRAEKHLLEALYGHISSLGKFESDTLLEEDPDIMQRRAATKKVCSHHPAFVVVVLIGHHCVTAFRSDYACFCFY